MRKQDVLILDPCAEPTDRMARTANGHYCGRCRKHVQDLSQLTEEAATIFLALNPTACVGYWVDVNDNLVHAPQKARSETRSLPLAVLGAAALSVACNQEPTTDTDVATVSTAGLELASTGPGNSTSGCDSTGPANAGPSNTGAQGTAEGTSRPSATGEPLTWVQGGMPSVPTTQATRPEASTNDTQGTRPKRCDPPWYIGPTGKRLLKPTCID
jgi:hypothetical protein